MEHDKNRRKQVKAMEKKDKHQPGSDKNNRTSMKIIENYRITMEKSMKFINTMENR